MRPPTEKHCCRPTFRRQANLPSATVSVIDTASNGVTATIPVGVGPYMVAVDPAGNHAYVTNFDPDPVQGDYRVSVIDTASNGEVARVPVGAAPIGVAVAPDGRR
jgi:YVTN family beta-propeller protein